MSATSRVTQIASRAAVTAANDGTDGPLAEIGLPDGEPGFYNAVLRATENSGTGALTVTIQDSLDGNVPWFDWVAFTAVTASGGALVATGPLAVPISGGTLPTGPRDPLPFLRVSDAVSGDGNYTYTVDIATRRKHSY